MKFDINLPTEKLEMFFRVEADRMVNSQWRQFEPEAMIIARQKHLNFPPGNEYLYSNSGYFLISQIIPRATEKSLREWADERIFQPLGMTNTFFLDDLRMIVPNRATGYRRTKGGGFEVDVSKIDLVGDGGVFTTVEDLLIWDQNFYDNKRVGTPS